ncbi:MAG: undecaprenyl-diphosphate phosphatase, partial [Halobacteria archaeon]|nr:undecaprenyl-diphosphate phosphatase [Halobacteria archaeon]
MDISVVIAVAIGLIQGIFEWLPVSSEGNISLFLTLFTDVPPESAVELSLFLHAGTAVSATAYYRGELVELASRLGEWKPGFDGENEDANISFLIVATFVSVAVGGVAYTTLKGLASEVAGGTFVAIIGVP